MGLPGASPRAVRTSCPAASAARLHRGGARAEPALLIADEAVTALDVSVQAQILNLMHDIQQDMGLAVLFVAQTCRSSRTLATASR